MPDVAICYWGMSRSTRHVYQSHYKHIFDILKNAGLSYDTYFHTWDVNVNIIWDWISDVLPDKDEYKFLQPTKYKVENQDEFLSTIDMADYFSHEDARSGKDWNIHLVRNHLCALQSQKRVTQMMLDSGKTYTHVLYVRPDVEIEVDLPLDILQNLKPKHIAIPDFDHWEGYNGRGAILRFEDCVPYSHRINEIKEFRKNISYITSEKYTKYIVDKYYTFVPMPFKFDIIRPKA
jgi:hypothetical protein